jgi:hypothetical protein
MAARVSQHVVEVLYPFTPAGAYTPGTNALVSQDVIEVLGSFPGQARVAQYVIEVLMADSGTTPPPTPLAGGPSSFGYVS